MNLNDFLNTILQTKSHLHKTKKVYIIKLKVLKFSKSRGLHTPSRY